MNMNVMSTTADQVCDTMRLLNNKSRLMILCLLHDGEKSVGELVDAIGAREPAVSQHLALMRHHGIIQARREGRSMIYSVADPQIGQLLEALYGIYCGNEADQRRQGT